MANRVAWRDGASLALRLLEVASWLTEAEGPDRVLQRAAEGLHRELGAHSTVAYLYHARERALELRTALGRVPRMRPYMPVRAAGITSRLLSTLQPVVVSDSLTDPAVRAELVDAGVRAFVGLPLVREQTVQAVLYVNFPEPTDFPSEFLAALVAFARQVSVALDRAEAARALQVARDRMIVSLVEAVDARDHPTGGHSRRIQVICRAVGQALGLDADALALLETAALLHDIGKIGVRDAVLLKPAQLSSEERREVEQHSLIGARILAAAGLPGEVVEAVRHVHERWDGAGYPAGLAGERIPVLSRVVAVADAFEAMTTDRPYRRGISWEDALSELERHAGSQFDPVVVRALGAVLGDPSRRTEIAAEINAVSPPRADPTLSLHPVEAASTLAKSFYAFAWYFIEGFEKAAGAALAEQLVDQLAVIPLFEPSSEHFGVMASRATVVRRLKEYRDQLHHLLNQASRVCGERLCDALVEEALRRVPRDLREVCTFLLGSLRPAAGSVPLSEPGPPPADAPPPPPPSGPPEPAPPRSGRRPSQTTRGRR